MNKKVSIFLILLISVLFSFGFAQEKASEGAKMINKMKFPGINFKVPKVGKDVERYVLPNGIVCFIKQDRSLPIVNIDIIIKAGEIFEKKEQHGVAYLCAANLRAGGTKNYTAEEINKDIDYKDIIIEFDSSSDYSEGTLNTLSRYFDDALKYFADMLINPAFEEEKFKIEKTKFLDDIARIKDSPKSLLPVEFNKFIYGDHPYGWKYDEDTVKKITVQGLRDWHGKYFTPGNIMMAISGDFDAAALKEKLNEAFGAWNVKSADFPKIARAVNVEKPGCLIVNMDVPQAYIRMGNLIEKYEVSDIVPASITNYILGGDSFTSYLMAQLREKRGLTYGAYSAMNLYGIDSGIFYAGTFTKTKNTYEVLALMLDITKKLKEKGVTDDELRQAKDAYINKFVFGLTPVGKILYKLMLLEFYNLPKDYYDNYIKNVEKVTKEDILRCARTYLHPESIKVVIVGNEKEIKADVEKLIPVIK